MTSVDFLGLGGNLVEKDRLLMTALADSVNPPVPQTTVNLSTIQEAICLGPSAADLTALAAQIRGVL